MARSNATTQLTGRDLPSRIDEDGNPVWDKTPESANRNASLYSDTELRGISSFEEAKRLATEKFGSIDDATEVMGTGFTVLNGKDKDKLVKVPFVILSMDFNTGDQGPYVSFLCVTEDDRKYVVNDGGTGIYKQLDEWMVRTGKGGGLFVNGLRKSEYDHPEHGRSTTYYLSI